MQNKHFCWIIIAIIGLLLFPGLINFFVQKEQFFNTVGEPKEWLMFWGSYFGAILSAIIPLFVLLVTLRQNQKENESNRNLQLMVLQHQQQMQWLTELKSRLVDYYNAFNHNNISILGDLILSRDSEKFKEAINIIKISCDTKNSTEFALGIMFPEKRAAKETGYLSEIKNYNLEYHALIEDLEWLIFITKKYFSGTYSQFKDNLLLETQNYKNENRIPEITENRIFDIMKTYNYDTYGNFKQIVSQRMDSTKKINPETIQSIISKLVDYEQEKINKILIEI